MGAAGLRRLRGARVSPDAAQLLSTRAPVGRRRAGWTGARRVASGAMSAPRGGPLVARRPRSIGAARAAARAELLRPEPGPVHATSSGRSSRPSTSTIHYYPEARAAMDAARMAERAYARLSRVLDHQFREKKPIMLFASRADFGAEQRHRRPRRRHRRRHRSAAAPHAAATSPATIAASSTCSRTRWCTRSSTTSSRAAKPATGSRRWRR